MKNPGPETLILILLQKQIFLILILFISGCASMSIIPDKKGCKLKGWGSGEGTIENKCTVKKSIFTWPNLSARVNP